MKMKKLVSAALTLIMVTSLSACGSSESGTTEKSLYEHGQDVVSVMVEATRSEDYVQVYTSSPEIREIVQGIGGGNYTTPKAVYSLKVRDEALLRFAELGNVDGASEELMSNLKDRVLGSMMTQLNGLSGVNDLSLYL